MDDLPEKLRRYYTSKSLSDDAVERMLALGREAGRKRLQRRMFFWSVAAVLALAATGLVYRQLAARPELEVVEVETAMQAFFNRPDYQLARVSSDLPELQRWLKREGAPADSAVPADFARLSVYGCQVLHVREQSVYMLCFLLSPAGDGTAPMPGKKAMTTTQGEGGPMMKKSPSLVHFVAVPRSAFKTPPSLDAPVVLAARGGWEFAEWRRGDVVYIAGGVLPEPQLRQLVAKL